MKEEWGMKDRNLLSDRRNRIGDIEKGSARDGAAQNLLVVFG